jgi:hypothetical protein
MTRHAKPALTPEQIDAALKIIAKRIRPEHVIEAARLLSLGGTGQQGLNRLRMMMLELAQTGSGARCVTCGGHFQVQYRVINKAMARVATDICRLWNRRGYPLAQKVNRETMFIKPEKFLRSASLSREFPKLRFWGLVTGRAATPEADGIEGTRWTEWTIFPALVGYVLAGAKLPRWAVILHDELIALAGPLQDIDAVEDFSVQEYMEEPELDPPPDAG